MKKVLTRSLPRYYLRSRKRYAPLFKPVVSVADQETQADLSDEDCEALFAELPFIFFQVPKAIPKLKSTLIRVQVIRIQSHKFQRHPDVQQHSVPPLKAKLQILISEISASIATTNPLCARATLRTTSRHTHTPDLSRTIVSVQPILHWTFKRSSDSDIDDKRDRPLTVEITPYSYHLWWSIHLPI